MTTTATIRKALKARRDAAPHAADAIPVSKGTPDTDDIREAVRGQPRVSFDLGTSAYKVRDCWEVYDLMLRNLGGLLQGPWGNETRDLRIDKARWAKRKEDDAFVI